MQTQKEATNKKTRKTSFKKSQNKTKEKISYFKKPPHLSLTQWQLALRRQFGELSEFTLKNTGDHPVFTDFSVTNPEKDSVYKVSIRPKNYTHFCSCKDFKSNHLGTCKHIEFVLHTIDKNKRIKGWLKKDYFMPYSSIYLEYLEVKRIRFRLGSYKSAIIQKLASIYFDRSGYLKENKLSNIETFINKIRIIDPNFKCYDDALKFILKKRSDEKRRLHLQNLFINSEGYFEKLVKTKLYPYQQQGVLFAVNKGRSIIADDMGLGKTIQAIAAAELFIKEFQVNKILIVCPTSLKYQWQSEIQKFTDSSVQVIEGNFVKRQNMYAESQTYHITSYNCIKSDIKTINTSGYDLVILDEAQRIKNWDSMTSRYAKRIETDYTIVLTGTPMENKLTELFSIVQFVDPYILGPYHLFVYEHTLKDESEKIIGYKNLHQINAKLKNCLLRRKKNEVLKQLPERVEKIQFVPMTVQQMEIHNEQKQAISKLVIKWKRFGFLTEQERQKLQILLNIMRMVCDSTYIIDQLTRYDNKILELRNILEELLSNPENKIVIFSQWERMTRLIAYELDEMKIEYSNLHGSIPSKNRRALIENFQNKDSVKVFLSTDAGSVGLNLQAGNYIFNMDLPWNPAVLEQRIGRIHRMGQKRNIMVINFVAIGTIEERMLSVLKFKSNLAAEILDNGENIVFMDQSAFASMMDNIEKMTDTSVDQSSDYTEDTQIEIIQEDIQLSSIETEMNLLIEDLVEEESTLYGNGQPSPSQTKSTEIKEPKLPPANTQELQEVMQQGLAFFSSLIKMGTGKEIQMNQESLKIDPITGEVIFKFKLPVNT